MELTDYILKKLIETECFDELNVFGPNNTPTPDLIELTTEQIQAELKKSKKKHGFLFSRKNTQTNNSDLFSTEASASNEKLNNKTSKLARFFLCANQKRKPYKHPQFPLNGAKNSVVLHENGLDTEGQSRLVKEPNDTVTSDSKQKPAIFAKLFSVLSSNSDNTVDTTNRHKNSCQASGARAAPLVATNPSTSSTQKTTTNLTDCSRCIHENPTTTTNLISNNGTSIF